MSWTRASLEELASVIDYGVTASANFSEGKAKFLRITDIQDNSVDWTKVPYCDAPPKKLANAMLADGDIVFARTGATTGKSFLLRSTPKNAVFASYLIRVRPTAQIDSGYLAHFFNTADYWAQIRAKAQGAAQEGVNASKLASLEIPFPPLDEQKRIAAILDKVDHLRQKRRHAIALLDSLTQSIFLEIFGDPVSNPRRYAYAPLSDLIDPKDRLNYGVVQPGDTLESGVPLIRVSDLKNGAVDRLALKHIDPRISSKHSKSVLNGREILISCVGSIGEIAVASNADRGSNVARAVARVPLRKDVSRAFVAAYLRTDAVQNYFTKELRTVSQPTLNIKQISETLIPLVDPEEANQFEEKLGLHQKLQQTQNLQLSETEAMFSSLQHRAFSGKL